MSLKNRLAVQRVAINWGQWVAREFHYLHREVHPRAHPFAYQILFDGATTRPDGQPCGMVMFATVHYTRQKELFGYDTVTLQNCTQSLTGLVDMNQTKETLIQLRGLLGNNWDLIHQPGLDKWQVLVLSRMWLHDDLPYNSETCVLGKIWKRIQRDWLEHHPPVDTQKPYHIRLIISWSDLGAGHHGGIYRAANFKEIKRTRSQARHGKGNTRGSGGFDLVQYAYWLKKPRWRFEQPKLL